MCFPLDPETPSASPGVCCSPSLDDFNIVKGNSFSADMTTAVGSKNIEENVTTTIPNIILARNLDLSRN